MVGMDYQVLKEWLDLLDKNETQEFLALKEIEQVE